MPLCKEAARRVGNITLYSHRRVVREKGRRKPVVEGKRGKEWAEVVKPSRLVRAPSIYYNLNCLSKKPTVGARTYIHTGRALMRCRSLIIPPASRKYAWIIYRAARKGYRDEWLIHACVSLFSLSFFFFFSPDSHPRFPVFFSQKGRADREAINFSAFSIKIDTLRDVEFFFQISNLLLGRSLMR